MAPKQVKIPHDYFYRMSIRDYYSWKSALFREFIQNSVDADSTTIEFKYDGEYLTIRDNGCGMDSETIENALLTLGGTKKDGDTVGGMGKAKEILYFSWPDWMISTKGLKVSGNGPMYSISKTAYREGVTSRIKIGDNIQAPLSFIKEYLVCSSLKGRGVEVYYNGEPVKESGLKYGKKIYTIDGLGDLYKVESSNFGNGRIMVQSRGLYMFSNYSVLDQFYVFNITQPSYDCLTSNRDSFVSQWQDKFSQMVGIVAIDTESTNLKKETVIQVQTLNRSNNVDPVQTVKETVGPEGYTKLQQLAEAHGMDVNNLNANDIIDLLNGSYLMTETIMDKSTREKIKIAMTSTKAVNKAKIFDECLAWYKRAFSEGFIIVSDEEITTDLIYYIYDINTLKMVWLWKETLDEIADKAGIKQDYGYGILIDEDMQTFAQCRDGYLLINPYAYNEMTWEECALDMILTASEELAHHVGYTYHNESFKNKYSEILKVALDDRVKIRSLLNTVKKVTKKHGIKTVLLDTGRENVYE